MCLLRGLLVAGLLTGAVVVAPPIPARAAGPADDWPTSLHDVARTAASNDTTISPGAAATLGKLWSFHTGGPVATTPTVAGGVAYFGSWDGYEYAVDAATGALKWRTYLGVLTANPICIPPKLGLSSPATVLDGVVYVGGGDAYWYALDATSGAVLWRVFTQGNGVTNGSYDGHYNWSAPLIVGGFAYIGVASLGDCPLVQGALIKVDLTSHAIVNNLNLVPNGQVGGGIWTSPAYDAATNTIFTATGTENSPTQGLAQAFLAIDADTLEVKDSWKLPESQAVLDSDFSTSTTLFSTTTGTPMVASINKNGDAYGFRRGDLSSGPVWRTTIAQGGQCPTCGQSSVSSGAFGQNTLYLAGSSGSVDGVGYPGTVRALDPATGAYRWQHGGPGAVIGALAYDNGMILAGSGSVLEVLDATTGARLYSYDTGAQIYAGPSVAGGVIYTGDVSGTVYAFALPPTPPPAPPADPACPSGWTCQDLGGTGSESTAGDTWTVSSSGTGVPDSARLIAQPGAGDRQLTANIGTVAANAQVALVARQSTAPGAPFYAVVAQPGNTVQVMQRRLWAGPLSTFATASDAGAPYVMLLRTGDTFQAALSATGDAYTLISGSNASLPLPSTTPMGIEVAGGSPSISAVTLGAPGAAPAPGPSVGGCPSGWSCQDVGNPSIVGDQQLAAGTWSVTGAGGDIWAAADQFHFVSQSLSADGTVSARVTGQTATDPSAKAGVMLRAGTGAADPYYAAYVTPAAGIEVQYRQDNGVSAAQVANPTGTAPAYLQVARSGTGFTAYTSPDGVNWTAVPASTVQLAHLAGTIRAGLSVTSHNTGAASTATFTNVAIGTAAPPPPNLCPSGWSCADIGFPTPAGSQTLSGGKWTVSAGGGDMWDTTDQFRLIAQPQTGDGGISAHVTAQANTSDWAKSGVMERLSADPQAPYYGVFVTPGHGVVVQYRSEQNAGTIQVSTGGTVPDYLQVGRVGTTFTAYTSTDGTTWSAVPGSVASIPALSGTLLAGLAVCAHNTVDANTTTFDTVQISGAGSGTGGLPVPWDSADIGAATPIGSASYSNDVFTVQGGGTDIWGSADQQRYVSQALTGDGTIVAQVTGQSVTDPWAKAGVMIKQSTTAGSPYALLAVTPGNGIAFQWGYDQSTSGGGYTLPNVWLRLDRQGSVFTAYRSGDGSNWTRVGQAVVAMPAAATVGLSVTAHNGGTALSTATFTHVTVIPAGGAPVGAPWISADIGAPLVPGSASQSGSVYRVRGSGGDIWGTADQFQYAYQPLPGDGTITARVTAVDNADPWTKAGVMVKQSAVSGSPYVLLAVTPGNNMHLQYGFGSDVGPVPYRFPDAWVRLTRTGSTVTAYTSADGVTWTTVGTTTLPGGVLTVGLFTCAHRPDTLATATFDNVSVFTG
jgi:outer membrane protein assembly factor BamB/regulation of enolase protein 1 (concanavalin A-like superfamily)